MMIQLNDISLRFGAYWALARVSCDIPLGSRLLLTGENGAGKTTFLRLLATVLKPTSGQLTLWGLSASKNHATLRKKIGLLTHASYFYDALTAFENLQFLQSLKNESGAILQVLETVGLQKHVHRQVGGFSAGMKRRLGMARLLLQQPELILLDEPFGQLDSEGVELMTRMITDFSKQGATLIIATHDLDKATALCNWHLHLQQGRIQHFKTREF